MGEKIDIKKLEAEINKAIDSFTDEELDDWLKKDKEKQDAIELELINLATFSEDNDVSRDAMQRLRAGFDPSYHFCSGLDSLATTVSECYCERGELYRKQKGIDPEFGQLLNENFWDLI